MTVRITIPRQSKPKPNCHKCIYRRNIPGDAHSSCVHPDTGLADSQFPEFEQLAAILGVGQGAKAIMSLNIRANPVGVQRGWFMWPSNYDPVWLLNCDGFKSKEPKADATDKA